MPGTDPDHWLRRLTPAEWLTAAENELVLCQDALARRAARVGITHARRSAGMAINALLVMQEDARFGRSYMDHVVALATHERVPPEVRDAAALLRDTPPAPPALVTLGRPDMKVFEGAREIVEWTRKKIAEGPRGN